MEVKAGHLQQVQDVVRMVARSFMDETQIVVLDGLLVLTGEDRPSVKDEDLAQELYLQHKVVRAALSRLERECLVRSFERTETKGGKEIQQQYWRIDYKLFIDAVKLRIHKMQHSLHKAKAESVTLYICETCVDAEGRNPSWNEYEANEVLNMELGTFECPHCGEELTERKDDAADGGKVDIHQRMQKQLGRLLDALKKTEDLILPAPRPESAFIPLKQDRSKAGEAGGQHGDRAGGAAVHRTTIALTIDAGSGGMVAGGGWQNSDAGGSGTPNALGSFQALHARTESGEAGGGGGAGSEPAKADPQFQEWLRQYQEECKKNERERVANGAGDEGGWHGDDDGNEAVAGGAGEEGEEEFDDDDGEEEGSGEEEEEFEDEMQVMVAGRPMRLSEIGEQEQAKMTTKEYEEYCQAKVEQEQE